ncbi:MAG: KdsC family phosphatase [Candidatus Cryptobacteroides sp.]
MIDFNKIKAFAFDIDGVMTDGGIQCDLEGQLYRIFDAKDAFAIRMAVMNGYPVGIITGGSSGSIRKRFLTVGLISENIYLGSRDKIKDFKDFCTKHSLKYEEVMYFGDDTPDVDVLKVSGIGVCPSDASEDAKNASDYISPFPGGKGCVRDALEKVLKIQGKWNFDVNIYERLF